VDLQHAWATGKRAEVPVIVVPAAELGADSFDLWNVLVFLGDVGTLIWMSILGLAGKPGTEVDPTCSIRRAKSPTSSLIFSRQTTNLSGRDGS